MIQKIKDKEKAVSKNNGRAVKYRIRKQEENEHEEAIREYFRTSEEWMGIRQDQSKQPD